MKQCIYISKYPASQEATELELAHFDIDVKFAFESDYSYIKSKNGLTFQIIDEDNIVEVNVTEEELQNVQENLNKLNELLSEPEVTELPEDDDDDYYVQLHNLMLIDQIINNTLLQEGKLSSESCDNMLKLATLKHALMDEYCE